MGAVRCLIAMVILSFLFLGCNSGGGRREVVSSKSELYLPDPSNWSLGLDLGSATISGDSTPTISASLSQFPRGTKVYVFKDSTCQILMAEAEVSSSSFSLSLNLATDGSDDGSFEFFAYLENVEQNKSSRCKPTGLSFTYTTVSPGDPSGWTLDPSGGGRSNDTTPEISGSGVTGGLASEEGLLVRIFSDSSCAIQAGTDTTVSGGAFTFNSLTFDSDGTDEGLKEFYALVVNAAGLSSSCVNIGQYTLDTQGPSAPVAWALASPADGAYSNDVTPEISSASMTGENDAVVQIFTDSACATTAVGSATVSSEAFTVSNIAFLSDGSQDGLIHFYTQMTDDLGNVSSCYDTGLDYTLDTLAPADPSGWAMSSPSDGAGPTMDRTPVFTGSIPSEEGSTVLIFDESDSSCAGTALDSATVATGGAFNLNEVAVSTSVTVTGDAKSFYGLVTDRAGNTSSCTALGLDYTYGPTIIASWAGTVDSSYLGQVVDYVGNFNGDSYDDLVVVQPTVGGGASSLARVYAGASNGAGAMHFEFAPGGTDQVYNATGGGDYNNDGLDDLITYHRNAASGKHWINVYSGGASPSVIAQITKTNDSMTLFGMSLSFIGNFNGDTYDDAVALDRVSLTTAFGTVRVFLGDGDGTLLPVNDGAYDAIANQTYHDTEGIGDFNGDGYDDMALMYNSGGLCPAQVLVVAGSNTPGVHSTLFSATGVDGNDCWYGRYLTKIGDVNGDGRADLALVGRNADGTRRIDIYSNDGAGTTSLLRSIADGASWNGFYGQRILSVPDMNGDNKPEIGASDPYADGDSQGAFWIYSSVDGSSLYAVWGKWGAGEFSYGAASLGDYNGDGTRDLVVSEPKRPSGGSERGYVYILNFN